MTNPKIHAKIALVTGASSGIGRATALALAQNGAHLALASRNLPAMQELASQIQALGQEALVLPTDVACRDQVESAVRQAIDRFGRLDIVFSNAGQYLRSPIAEMDCATLERSIAVNFYSHVYLVKAALPHLLEQNSGHFLFNATMDAKKGLVPDAPYVSAKFALAGFAEVLRQELRGTGIHVTSLFVGRVDTPLIENLRVPWISAKIPAETVARATIKAIQRPRPEVFLPPQVLLLHYINVFAPSLSDWATNALHLQGWEIEKKGG
ncbi:MAG: SDR family NAD(P)-dependent oxidoreductase [Anaerolineales bacterium]|nr:SDR family NAD(P)-dependent oxidoreductase [Anaerolineales bacterium]